ncbi:Uncharacterised protein [Mycobacteroides abscessus]|nr:Uncharacterised protein [Mycobacteroides abscessus]
MCGPASQRYALVGHGSAHPSGSGRYALDHTAAASSTACAPPSGPVSTAETPYPSPAASRPPPTSATRVVLAPRSDRPIAIPTSTYAIHTTAG